MHSDLSRARRFTIVAIALALPLAASAAGDAAIVQQNAEVRAAPSASANQVTQAPANQPVQILDRRGAWYEVSSTSGWRGWVRLAAIRITSLSQPAKSRSTVPGYQPTAVVGIRGLDEASLARAQPDYAALERLRSYRATPQDADRFAAELARGGGQ